MHRAHLASVTVVVLLLGGTMPTSAHGSWAHTHLVRAWDGDLSSDEVADLAQAVARHEAAGVELSSREDAWRHLLLAIHYDAWGDSAGSCGLVARMDSVRSLQRDMRLDVLRAGCALEAGDSTLAAVLAKRGALAAAGTEPIDHVGLRMRAHELLALASSAAAAAQVTPTARRKAVAAAGAWERLARELNDRPGLVAALAHGHRLGRE